MKGYRLLLILAALLTFSISVQAQEEEEEEMSLENGTVDSQFEYVFTKSGNYRADGKRYEVVRTISLDKLRKNVMDTLSGFNTRAAELKATIAGHESTIASLEKKLEDTTNSLAAVTEEKDNMSFLGISVSKGTYNAILWTIIASLLVLLLFFIYKFRNSNYLTQEAKTNLSELETEYEDHRRRALDREQKISRQLQDEINKYKKQK